jgi:alpha,alpha-trehalose-phosphate synthase [UDP-forming]
MKPFNEKLKDRRFVVASNREPYVHRKQKNEIRCERPAGGVTAALDPLLKQVNGVWVAWGSGDADRETVDAKSRIRVPPDQPAYALRRVWLSPEEVQNYYSGYANRFLWPLCHVTLDKVVYRRKYWASYRGVNERFADAVVEEMGDRPGIVWIHDYHLAVCPLYVRRKKPDARISLFWHIPWPAHDVFRICPQRKELIEGMLACDQIGFHLDRYRQSFLECVKAELGAVIEPSRDAVVFRDHRTVIQALPVSIDYDYFVRQAAHPDSEKRMANLRKRLKARPDAIIGLGVDRLDYTKGLVKRFWALEDFLERYPEFHGRFIFLQVATPTRAETETYRDYRDLLRSTVQEINGRFGRKDWKPVEFIEGHLSHEALAAYYRLADFCLVTSLYDGMNLVSKEYVASQIDDRGVLILSEMAGSLEGLEGALPINPYDVEGMAAAIREAIAMPAEEKKIRMSRMRSYIQKYDIYHWMESNLRSLVVEPE